MKIAKEKIMINKYPVMLDKVWIRSFVLVLVLMLTISGDIYSQCSQLVWQDEFDGPNLDLTKWTYQTGNGTNDNLNAGWGNNELEYYTSRSQNVNVTGGNLELTALYEPNYLGTGQNYTSGRIRSTNPITNNPRNEWQYGSFEARIKVPTPYNDSRAWPGFWMLPHNGPWPSTGEIDIMETGNNNNPWYYNGTLHYGATYPGSFSGTGGVTIGTSVSCPAGPVGDLSVCFHLYRVDWAPNSIKFFVDNIQVGTTQTNATVGSSGTIGGSWPFDAANPYHILLNMAVGGDFPGSTVNNARYPLKMLVDYVRVYSTPAAVKITGKTKILQGQTGLTYSVSNVAGNTYSWTVPSGATITAGQNTNQITVNYGATAVSGNVSVTITPSGGGCVASTNSLAVSVLANACTLTLENFETSNPSTRNLGFNFATGWLNRNTTTSPSFPYGTYANPSVTGVNTSANVGKYERNAGVAYDVLTYNDIVIGNADDFKNGIVKFNMDVYSTAAAGTQVMIQLENTVNAQTGWPNGIHSRYTAVTGTANTWSTLQFTLLDTPDANMPATDVDQIVILFNPNTYTNNTYYFDNFKRAGVTPATSAITGSATVCQNNSGVQYSVTGFSNSTYAWTVPTGSTIVSGQGTNSIAVNFGTTSGNVAVTETSSVKCAGTSKTLAVTVAGSCVLTADFVASPTSTCAGGVVVFTDLTTGKTGGETYSWDFGAGASLPAGTTGAGPFNVTYSTGGSKTVALTVSRTGSTNTKTKTNYLTISAPPTGCLFSDDYNNATVSWIAPIPGAFTHAEAGTAWTISNAGYSEWENFTYTLNNGTVASPLNFGCASNAPVLKIRAKASANCLLRIQMLDGNGLGTDNVPGFNIELTTTYQTFTINYAGSLRNFYSATPGYLDSTNIKQLQLFINPGYVSYPYAGVNKTYNTAFSGTVDIDWMGVGNNCNFPGTAPTITSFTPTCGSVGSAVTITGTNLTGATNVSFNGTTAAVTSNTATQIVATVPPGVSNGKVSVTNAGGTVVSASNFNLSPATSAISGSATVCSSATNVVYSVTATAGSTYAWTLPTGATIASGSGTNSITVNFGTTTGNISVIETNAAGCVGTSVSKAIAFSSTPATPGTITGLASPCQGTATTYNITAVTGATSYTWTLPSGWTGSSTSASISATPDATTGSVTVTASNTCGTSAAATKAITPKSAPATPGAITGSASPCQGTATTYSITAVTGATSYTWTMPTGWTGSSTTASISATPNGTAGNVSVKATNTCGTSSAASLAVTPTTTSPSTPGAITGSASPCQGAASTYSITAVTGATSYTWTLPSGWTGSSTSASISATPDATAGSVTVTASNTCGTSATATKAITPKSAPATPGTIAGSATPCQGTATTYSITAVTGATSYTWTMPTGWTGSSTTSSISATPNGTAGSVSVKATNTCGTSASASLAVSPITTPATPGAITGSATAMQSTTGNAYSIAAVASASSYVWTYNGTGATIAGSGINITIDFSASATSGTLSVKSTNACGTSTAATLAITVNAATVSQPGAFTTSSSIVCQGQSGIAYTVPNDPTVTYQWSYSGTGVTINGSTNSITLDYSATANSGTLSVVAVQGVNSSSPRTIAITVGAIPATPGTISGSATPCQATATSYSITAITGATSYTWTLPTGWTGSSTAASISATPNGTTGSVIVTATNTCGTSAAASLAVTPAVAPAKPGAISGSASPCQGSILTYSITAVTGATSYIWTLPTGWTGSSTSASISATPDATAGSVTVKASNTCGTSAAATKAITPKSAPATPGTISGSTSPCQGAVLSYSITAVTGAVSYTWTLPSGWTGTSTTISLSATPSSTSGDVSVTATNTCGTSGASSLAVTPTAIPATPGAISGSASPCQGTALTYSITAVAGATSYTWMLPSGWTGSSTAVSISATPDGTAGDVTVTATNACGTSAASTKAVTPASTPLTPGTITGSATPCQGASITYGITAVTGATFYTWTMPSGWTGSSTLENISPIPDGTAGNITVAASNACGTSGVSSLAVTPVAVPSTPGAISGSMSITQGTTGEAYSIGAVSNVNAYNWIYSGTGGTINGLGTNVTLDFSSAATSGTLSVTAQNACGNSSPASLGITVTSTTGLPSGVLIETYSVSPNPFVNEFNLKISGNSNEKLNIKISDAKGLVLMTDDEHSLNENITLGNNLPSGVLFVQVSYGSAMLKVFKLVKVE